MRIAYFDCFCGAAGDMIVASLLDAGVELAALEAPLASLPVHGYRLRREAVTERGLGATRFHVELDHAEHQPHRKLPDIERLLGEAELPEPVREGAIAVFRRLAEAEAAVHRTTVDKVHFHEVGAVDAIVDITAAVLGLHLLGVERVIASPLPPGSGTVECAHGVLPVPAPATAALLKGVPLASCDEPGELVTPTGAALITTLAASFGPLPALRLERTGYGAGQRTGQTRANLLRVLIGEADPVGTVDEVVVLETCVDDVSAEVIGHALEAVRGAGALDAYAQPIQMKKSRPGVLVTVLAAAEQVAAIEELLFAELPTFGIRRHAVQRRKLDRRLVPVMTPFGSVRVKVGASVGGETLAAAPEFEDCRAAAQTHGVALRAVQVAAQLAWAQQCDELGAEAGCDG